MSNLYIGRSAIAGRGCFAGKNFRKGEQLGEYTGEIISGDEADKRYADDDQFYIFLLDDGSCIDPGDKEIPEKYMNHSCEPNAETEEDDGRVFIYALRDIKEGEEITFDYCVVADEDEDLTCHCGAPTCRGTMRAQEE